MMHRRQRGVDLTLPGTKIFGSNRHQTVILQGNKLMLKDGRELPLDPAALEKMNFKMSRDLKRAIIGTITQQRIAQEREQSERRLRLLQQEEEKRLFSLEQEVTENVGQSFSLPDLPGAAVFQ